MLLDDLRASPFLKLCRYADIDQFRESERYAGAESMPLKAGPFAILRASLALPSGALSLVRTFPRIIRGYNLSDRFVIVVPMDEVTSTRVNGTDIGRSLVILQANADCTVYEPEGRLVAILSVRCDAGFDGWPGFDGGHALLQLPDFALARLQTRIRDLMKIAGSPSLAGPMEETSQTIEARLFAAFDEALSFGQMDRDAVRARYKEIVDQIDRVVNANPATDVYCDALAQEIGISARTMSSAVRAVCGTSPLRYSQLMRIWAVRQQLRNGSPGLTVKASAFAHGFWHLGDFSRLYRGIIGELPSQTLASARRLEDA